MNTIYIAGKITGLKNYKEKFKKAEDELTAKGWVCMNPSVLPEGFPYAAYMPICLSMIDQCKAMYMLDNWQQSNGANVEIAYGKVTGKQILFQE